MLPSPTSLHPSPGHFILPELPFEIIRRILHHRLALSPSIPTSPSPLTPRHLQDGWEGLPGQLGKKIAAARKKEREEVMRAALVLMRVCKSWKPVVQKYLYSSPPLTASSLLPFTAAVQLGDAKWDDTRLHPHSVPGRYISTLDLSTLSDGYFGPHVTSLSRACAVLLPLLPNLTHLKLPGGTGWGIIPAYQILDAPFVGRLKALEGVQISDDDTRREGHEVCRLLAPMRSLELLSVLGPGSSIFAPPPSPPKALDLPHLHTLTLDGIQHGPLISALTASELPSLRRVFITSYDETSADLTTPFLEAHGEKLLSLTFLPTREWPAIHPTPPTDILELWPNLRELGILLPNSALQKKLELAHSLTRGKAKDHPLESIVLPKWLDRVSASPSASPAPNALPQTPFFTPTSTSDRLTGPSQPPAGNPFLAALLSAPPRHLRKIRIDGFSWVSPRLGRAAQYAGAGGETRVWAGYMERRGVELVDTEGRSMPDISPGGSEGDDGMGGDRGRRRGSRGLGLGQSLWSGRQDIGRVQEADEDGG